MAGKIEILIFIFILSCAPVAIPSIDEGVSYSTGITYIPYPVVLDKDTLSNLWGSISIRYGVSPYKNYVGYRIGYTQYIPWNIEYEENLFLQFHNILAYGFVDLQLQYPLNYVDLSIYSRFVYGIPCEVSMGIGGDLRGFYPYMYGGWLYTSGFYIAGGLKIPVIKHFSLVIQPALFYKKIELFKRNRINFAFSTYFYFY